MDEIMKELDRLQLAAEAGNLHPNAFHTFRVRLRNILGAELLHAKRVERRIEVVCEILNGDM